MDRVEFRIGDVIRLRGGGALMTVGGVTDAYVKCQWFGSAGGLHTARFPQIIVQHETGPERSPPPPTCQYYLHEALDRTHVLRETFEQHVQRHVFLTGDSELTQPARPDLQAMAGAVVEAMEDLYQAIGNAE